MKHLMAARAVIGSCIAALCWAFLVMTSDVAPAQTTGTINSSAAPPEPAAKEDVPPGGCMPIGLTASGEIVFPIQCKEFIERARGKTVEQRPPAAEEKSAAKQPDAVGPEKGKQVDKPVETAAPRGTHRAQTER
jgi:hypothetical protein